MLFFYKWDDIQKEEETVGSGSTGRSHKQEKRKSGQQTPLPHINFKKKEEGRQEAAAHRGIDHIKEQQ